MPQYHSLPRRELTEKTLQSIREHSLTAIIAPMGYGKSTLAASLAEAVPGTACVYTLPEGPHDARFLWHNMLEHLEAQGMDIVPAIRELGFPESASQRLHIFELLRGLTLPACIIIDDYQQAQDQALDNFLEALALAAIPTLRLVLFSRTHPAISLMELCVKGHAVIYEQDFLAFSQEETEAYFRLNNIHDQEAARDIWRFCEGWPAAIWLCMHNWQSSGRMFKRTLASDSIEALTRKVFSSYDAEEQDLLLCLSIMDSFTEQDAITLRAVPRTSARLWALREKNALLSLNKKTGLFSFHSIFKEFLRKELRNAGHLDQAALCRVAGECCLKRRELVPGLRLFARAGRDEDLRRILDLFLLYEHDEDSAYFYEEIFSIGLAIPWRVRLQHPLGWLAFAAAFTAIWNDNRSSGLLEEALERFKSAPELPEHQKQQLAGEYEAIRGMLAFNDMDKVWRHYAHACRLLNGPSRIFNQGSLWSFGCPAMTFISLRAPGAYEQLAARAEQNLHLYRRLSGGAGKGAEQAIRAEYLVERGDFARAEALLDEVLRQCAQERNKDKNAATTLVAGFCLTRLYAASGRGEEATRLLAGMRSGIEHTDVIGHLDCLELAEGYSNAVRARPGAIARWLREGRVLEPPHSLLPQVFGFSLTVYGKALMLRGEWSRLASVAGMLRGTTLPLESLFARIHGAVLEAVAAWHRSGRDKALSLLREALELSRPDGIILSLAEYGGHIHSLLRLLKRMAPDDAHLAAIAALAEQFARLYKHAARTSTRSTLLTQREQEIMRHVADGKTNRAIAADLGISSDAVKQALKQIYSKLQVAKRVEAVQRFARLCADKGDSP